MGSQVVTFAASIVLKSKLTASKWLSNQVEIGRDLSTGCMPTTFRLERITLPMTSYLEAKAPTGSDVPGPLCFSERIALHPLNGTSVSVYADQSLETIKKSKQVISTM